MPDEQPRMYSAVYNVPLDTHNIPLDQQMIYASSAGNFQSPQNHRYYANPHQVLKGQATNHYTTSGAPAQSHYQQQVTTAMNIPPHLMQQSMGHSNMHQQQVLVPSYQAEACATEMPLSSMTNPTDASTPIAMQNKRGRNDTSGASESYVQLRPQQPQMTRFFSSSNTPNKRHRGVRQQQQENLHLAPHGQLQAGLIGQSSQTERNNGFGIPQQPSIAACRYATSRYPFSPFSVIFTNQVREKTVVDELITHAQSNLNFELKTIAYRKGRSEDKEHRILIFVENTESFAFLYDRQNWPTVLGGSQYTTKSPSIPPQLALVLPYVALQLDWDEFVQEVQKEYPGIANVIRLKNKAQQPVRAVKLEFNSAKLRDEILGRREISIMHMKLRVVEYFAQANVLICSNCQGLGHFRKNCPLKDETTCKTCGEKFLSGVEHQCSGVEKCIRCGGPHNANDAKCEVVRDYRAALTRNLLQNIVPGASKQG